MTTISIPVRRARIKTFREYLRDYGMPDDTPKDGWDSTFVYQKDGSNVPDDAVVLPWGSEDDPDRTKKKLRKLEDILGKYADSKGWDYMEIGEDI